MRFFFTLLCLLVLAGPAGAGVVRVGGTTPNLGIITAQASCPTIDVTPRGFAGPGTFTFYAVDDLEVLNATNVIANGTLLGTVTTAGNHVTQRWTPNDKNIVAFSTGESDLPAQATIEIECLNFGGGGGGVVSASTVDVDGDGRFEYVAFPLDFDGDGTTWQTCDCGGGTTPGYTTDYICGTFRAGDDDYTQTDYSAGDDAGNPAECRFEGQRVWDDATDDLNALYNQSGPGFEIDFAPGTYAMKGGNVPTSDSGTHVPTTCWDSGTASYGGTCQVTTSGRTLIKSAEFPWSGTVLTGSGVDQNGDMDLVYEGTMFVTNSGPRTFWNTSTVNNGFLSLGLPAVGASATGGILVEKTLDSDLEATLCLDATFTQNEIVEGSLLQFTLTHAESGRLNRTIARVSRITSTVCGGTGREITVGASTPLAIDQMPNTLYQTYLGQTATVGSVVVVIEEDELAANIDLSRVWFTHLDYIGAGGCDPAGDHEAAACDTGVSLQVNAGFNHKIHDIGVIQTAGSFGSGQAINTTPTSSGVKFEDSIFRFNQGGLIDVPQYAWFRDNVVTDNTLLRDNDYTGVNPYNAASMIRVQADNYHITSNVFERNVAPIEFDNNQTQAGSAIIEMGGKKGYVGSNLFRMNSMTCVGISQGSRELLLESNTLDCGSNNRADTIGTDVRDRAYAVVVQSTSSAVTGDLTFRSNRFTGLGGHYLNQAAMNIEDPRAHVLFTGVDFNIFVDTAGDLAGLIIFEGNEFAAASDRLSMAVAMRVNSATSDGDPDAGRLWFDGNRVEQGGLFGTVWMGAGNGSGSGNLDGLDPDNDNDGVGLPLCGVNFFGDTPQLDYTSMLLDDRTDGGTTLTLSNPNITNGTATPQVNQCDSIHTP